VKSDLSNGDSQLVRVNLMLSAQDSAWLNEFSEEVRHLTDGRISRSEIVRAALAALREVRTFASREGVLPLEQASNGAQLIAMTVLAVRNLAIK
jgi:hypothetical protein